MLKSRFVSANQGNVLFLILIAVALFAALTMALTKSNEGGSNMGKERGSLNATDVMSFGSSMEKTVARMMSGEMSESGLSFENDQWHYNNGDAVETAAMFAKCTSTICKVFDPAGGGLAATTFAPQDLPAPVDGDVKSGQGIVYALTVDGVGSAAQDLVLMIADINKDTCMAINNSLHIDNPSDSPPADSWAGAVPYDGTFASAADATGEIGDEATQIVGKSAGCIMRSGGAYGSLDNYFYQVLLPR